MTIDIKHKLNYLLTQWPTGAVYTARWLQAQGYSPQLLRAYCQSGWLHKLGHGAYARLQDNVSWEGGVYALQTQLTLPVHVGGLSALELQGLAQYLQLGDRKPVHLFNTSATKKSLPKWFHTQFPEVRYHQRHLFDQALGLQATNVNGTPLQVSRPERAILEVLALVPDQFEYAHASELAENLQLLVPNVMQSLLETCRSYKVKRLFLYFAQMHQLPCFDHLDVAKIDLGKGKRKIGTGGHYNATYRLSVPE